MDLIFVGNDEPVERLVRSQGIDFPLSGEAVAVSNATRNMVEYQMRSLGTAERDIALNAACWRHAKREAVPYEFPRSAATSHGGMAALVDKDLMTARLTVAVMEQDVAAAIIHLHLQSASS